MAPLIRTRLSLAAPGVIAFAVAAPAPAMAGGATCDWDDLFICLNEPVLAAGGAAALNDVAIADLDDDGDLDFIATGVNLPSDYFFTVVLVNGEAAPTITSFPTAGVPGRIRLADFDGDGVLDVAIATITTPFGGMGGVAAHRGVGDGTFEPGVHYSFGASSPDLAVADFDADGALDLVLPDAGGTTVAVLRGAGDGTFLPLTEYAVGDAPSGVEAVDVDQDGDVDLVTANASSDDLSILLNQGDGTFGAPQPVAAGAGPSRVVAADFDGDGIVDLAVTLTGAHAVQILTGNGDGTYATGQTLLGMEQAMRVILWDANGDDTPDLVVTGGYKNLWLLTAVGDGTFARSPEYPLSSAGNGFGGGIAAGDLDGDSRQDILVAQVGAGIVTARGNGDGSLDCQDALWAPSALNVEQCDMNGDGIADVVALGNRNFGHAEITVAIGAGGGAFPPPVHYLVDLPQQTWGSGLTIGDGAKAERCTSCDCASCTCVDPPDRSSLG